MSLSLTRGESQTVQAFRVFYKGSFKRAFSVYKEKISDFGIGFFFFFFCDNSTSETNPTVFLVNLNESS